MELQVGNSMKSTSDRKRLHSDIKYEMVECKVKGCLIKHDKFYSKCWEHLHENTELEKRRKAGSKAFRRYKDRVQRGESTGYRAPRPLY